MKTSVSQVDQHTYKLEVEVPVADLGPYFERTYRNLARDFRVPGFRPGKAPRQVIDKRLGKDFVRNQVLNDSLSEIVTSAVTEAALDVVAPPTVDVKDFPEVGDLTFEATVEVRPTAELGPYLGIGVSRPEDRASDQDVDAQIDSLRNRFATLESVDRPAETGDFVRLDIETTSNNEPVDGLTASDLLLEVGSGMLVEELDPALVGAKTGDVITTAALLPERFGDRAGIDVVIKSNVNEVRAKVMPDVTDAWVSDVSEHDTVSELRSAIAERVSEMKLAAADRVVRERVIDKFVSEIVNVDLPPGMLRVEMDVQLEQFARELSRQGIGFAEYLKHEGIDADAARDKFREQAELNLKVRLGLDAVARSEELASSDEQRTEHVGRLAEMYGETLEVVSDRITQRSGWDQIDGDILRTKALDLLVERAEITKEVSE